MAYQGENNADRAITPSLTNEAVAALLPVLTQHENPLAELLSVVLNAAMRLERQEHLRAEPHERCAERNGRDRKSTRLNSSHHAISRMPSSA